MEREVNTVLAGGGTDIYYAIHKAHMVMQPYIESGRMGDYLPAIIAMTDGKSEEVNRRSLLQFMSANPVYKIIPIYTISFGDVDQEQLDEISNMTVGRGFDGEKNLVKALRSAKGYN